MIWFGVCGGRDGTLVISEFWNGVFGFCPMVRPCAHEDSGSVHHHMEVVMSLRRICLAAGFAVASASMSPAAAQTASPYLQQRWTPEVWRACTRESKNWQKDVAGGTDTFRDHVFQSCANNGGVMPGAPMPRHWYP